ncbi:MAG: ion transporter [Rhodobacteraceae bacterium]|nr:ion transporter [Paracoccaceae bacterium]
MLNRARCKVGKIVESPLVVRFITALIVLNAITLGLETSAHVTGRVGHLLLIADQIILAIFVLELLAKIFAYSWRFFTSGWNIFDFVIVGIALVPSNGALAVLRSLRILRAFRLITIIPSMRRVVSALMAAIPGMASVVALLLIVYYIFGVMVTKLYGAAFPDWFGTIGKSMYSLFQIMTLESWSMGIVRPVMEIYPYAWLAFVPFILITSFAVINLFIAVIVNAMTEMTKVETEALQEQIHTVSEAEMSVLLERMKTLQTEMKEIRSALERR